jgi:hypothetical protein
MGRYALKRVAFSVLLGVAAALPASAEVVITLAPKDLEGRPIRGPVAPGTEVNVDILVSTPLAADPIVDVRLFQFDFGASSPTLELGLFKWDISQVGYGFQSEPKVDYPVAGAASLQFATDKTLIILTHEPVRVATVSVLVSGNGTLSLQPQGDGKQRCRTRIDAGFAPRIKYTAEEGKISSARFEFSTQVVAAVATTTPQRVEPMPPMKRRKCGAVAISSYLLLFGGLSLVGRMRRVRK